MESLPQIETLEQSLQRRLENIEHTFPFLTVGHDKVCNADLRTHTCVRQLLANSFQLDNIESSLITMNRWVTNNSDVFPPMPLPEVKPDSKEVPFHNPWIISPSIEQDITLRRMPRAQVDLVDRDGTTEITFRHMVVKNTSMEPEDTSIQVKPNMTIRELKRYALAKFECLMNLCPFLINLDVANDDTIKDILLQTKSSIVPLQLDFSLYCFFVYLKTTQANLKEKPNSRSMKLRLQNIRRTTLVSDLRKQIMESLIDEVEILFKDDDHSQGMILVKEETKQPQNLSEMVDKYNKLAKEFHFETKAEYEIRLFTEEGIEIMDFGDEELNINLDGKLQKEQKQQAKKDFNNTLAERKVEVFRTPQAQLISKALYQQLIGRRQMRLFYTRRIVFFTEQGGGKGRVHIFTDDINGEIESNPKRKRWVKPIEKVFNILQKTLHIEHRLSQDIQTAFKEIQDEWNQQMLQDDATSTFSTDIDSIEEDQNYYITQLRGAEGEEKKLAEYIKFELSTAIIDYEKHILAIPFDGPTTIEFIKSQFITKWTGIPEQYIQLENKQQVFPNKHRFNECPQNKITIRAIGARRVRLFCDQILWVPNELIATVNDLKQFLISEHGLKADRILILRTDKGIQHLMKDDEAMNGSKVVRDGCVIDVTYSHRARDGKHEYHVSDIQTNLAMMMGIQAYHNQLNLDQIEVKTELLKELEKIGGKENNFTQVESLINREITSSMRRVASLDVFKSLVKVYSHNSCYSGINQSIVRGNQVDAFNYLGLSVSELNKHQNLIEEKSYQNDKLPVYRGINKNNLNLNDHNVGSLGFWPSFTSTSRDYMVAKMFAANKTLQGDTMIIFKIYITSCNISFNKVPSNIMLDEEWSYFGGENEVLLMPYFCFQVVKSEIISQEETHITLVEVPNLNLLKIREIQQTRFIWADTMAQLDPQGCRGMIARYTNDYLLVSTSDEFLALHNTSKLYLNFLSLTAP